ncbi:hypothetical protein [Dongia deserti]|uniref:hypothetical protein n=1 Tax=Dongia deserti TaxID=2268030 RepID=UPI003899607B
MEPQNTDCVSGTKARIAASAVKMTGPRTLDGGLYDGAIGIKPFLAIGLDLPDQDERVAH